MKFKKRKVIKMTKYTNAVTFPAIKGPGIGEEVDVELTTEGEDDE